jgi:hypothetical protein
MNSIEAALAVIELLEPGEKFTYTEVANQYRCSRVTLAPRHKGVSTSRSLQAQNRQAQNRQALHTQQEEGLLRYIERLTKQGLPPSRPMIRRFASEIVNKELGMHWVDRFIKRYEVDLISGWATGIDRSRHQADSQSKYSLYFKLLRSKLSQYHIEPFHTYNIVRVRGQEELKN